MEQSWINGLLGGGLIGLASSVLLLANGRIAGLSGVIEGLLSPKSKDFGWKFPLLSGLILGGSITNLFLVDSVVFLNQPFYIIVIAGLCVGFGTRLGGGCTSGHGVCGISRFSTRSILATLTFMFTGAVTVKIVSLLSKGGL